MAESSFDEASARLSQVAARLLEWIQARGAPPCEVMVICFGRLPGRGSDEELPMGIGTTVSPELAQRVIAKLASMTPIIEIKDHCRGAQ